MYPFESKFIPFNSVISSNIFQWKLGSFFENLNHIWILFSGVNIDVSDSNPFSNKFIKITSEMFGVGLFSIYVFNSDILLSLSNSITLKSPFSPRRSPQLSNFFCPKYSYISSSEIVIPYRAFL